MNLRKELIKMTDKKILVFDMDGTIADFYGVSGWLDDLNNHRTRPYEIAKPLYNMVELVKILKDLKKIGYVIAITTWLSQNSTKEYDDRVRKAKLEWLKKYSFPYDEIHLVKYGTTKANCTRKLGGFQILVDDNEKVRKGWNLGATINANEDIIEKLKELL
jgi:phosphoglycolate phosphatase-like HAD superfamily hydrolase